VVREAGPANGADAGGRGQVTSGTAS
jgi:hypothetical protein